ncbi:unnamed protein product [Sphagnum compactum]
MSIPFTECSCGCNGKRKQEREGIKRPDTTVMPPVVLSDRHQHSATATYLEELDVTKPSHNGAHTMVHIT